MHWNFQSSEIKEKKKKRLGGADTEFKLTKGEVRQAQDTSSMPACLSAWLPARILPAPRLQEVGYHPLYGRKSRPVACSPRFDCGFPSFPTNRVLPRRRSV